MTKSIEKIWEQGFMKDDALIAPKVNDIYNRKSKHIADKLQRMFKLNIWGIAIAAVIMGPFLIYQQLTLLAVTVILCLGVMVWLGVRQLKELRETDKQLSSYEYLKSFNAWLQTTMKGYVSLYRWVYPILFVACMLQLRISEIGQKAISGYLSAHPDTWQIMATPGFLIAGVGVVSAALVYFTPAIYKADMYMVYGRVFAKLKEILADMEELRR